MVSPYYVSCAPFSLVGLLVVCGQYQTDMGAGRCGASVHHDVKRYGLVELRRVGVSDDVVPYEKRKGCSSVRHRNDACRYVDQRETKQQTR